MKRFKHSLSHYRLLTCDMGKLIPVSCLEVLPGDTFQQQTSALIRVSPLVAPVMHPVQVRFHHFYVPNRLIWTGWEDFITGANSTATPPTTTLGATTAKSIYDYLGVPPVQGLEVCTMPIRAYNKVYNEFFRDQDLCPEKNEDNKDLASISWEKDYFASARPWPQKGDAVTIPIGGDAPVVSSDATIQLRGVTENIDHYMTMTTGLDVNLASGPSSNQAAKFGADTGLKADLSSAESVDVREFRKAFALQRYQEARARYGSRYTEYLQYLGIKPSDARVQRPEYLGGGKQTIAFSEVLRTGNDQALSDGVIGEMSGHGIAAMRTGRYRKFFEEHGHVLTLMSVRPKAMYSQNLHKKWSRKDKEDYFQKELEAIGQQEVYSKEVFADATSADDSIFGYADRYREYREEPSSVSGEFRNTLNYWHMAREFASRPVLNQSFVECDATKRIHAEQTQDSLWCMVNHSIQARRMVNKNGNARII